MKLILASKSPFRKQLLENAGLSFDVKSADVDERAIETAIATPQMLSADIALILAQAKSLDVSERNADAIVIGCDQTLSFEGEMLHKPEDMEAARRRLLLLSGKTHQLNSAICLARDNQIIWELCDTSQIKFRDLDPAFVGRHLARVGDIALSSVGAYQIEGEGVQLFDEIQGDFFSIMGLPLIPLLHQLRKIGAIE